MSRRSAPKRAAGSQRVRGWIAGAAAVAVIATVAVVSSGFDSRETPRAEPSVWVTRDAGQYARVNTETGEIDTVRKVAEPSGVVQRGADSLVLSHGNGQAWRVDAASPQDLSDDAAAKGAGDDIAQEDGGTASAEAGAADGTAATNAALADAAASVLPDGARDVLGAGEYLLVRTESGRVYVGTSVEALKQLDPRAPDGAGSGESGAGDSSNAAPNAGDRAKAGQDGSALEFLTDAVALDAKGRVALYSASSDTLWQYDIRAERFLGVGDPLPRAATGIEQPELALVSGDWVLLDPSTGRVFRAGEKPQRIDAVGAARLQWSGEGDGAGGRRRHRGAHRRHGGPLACPSVG